MRNFYFRFIFITTLILSVSAIAFGQNAAFDINRMDKSVNACTDFFQFANGTWLNNTEIPGDQSSWGSFNILAENNRTILRELVDETVVKTDATKGSDTQLIGDFYFSCMNEAEIEAAGAKPISPYFNDINSIGDKKDLQKQIAKMHDLGIPVLFGFYGGTDLKNSKMVIANAGQGGLSMPGREYYIGGDPKMQEARDKFREYVVNMFQLMGDSEQEARTKMFTVMRIQMRLAYASLARADLRNPDNRYKKISVTEANSITPNFVWDDYMKLRGINGVDEFNIGQPDFFKAVNQMMNDITIGEWKTYLKWMAMDAAAPMLAKRFSDENFNFYSKYLRGTKEQQPRWRICVQSADGNVGEALGQLYVSKAFKPEAKERMDKLINNLFVAMRERIDQLEWMSDDTKVEALAKLATFKRKIGYPEKLRGYEGLDIDRKSYYMNSMRSDKFQVKRNLDDIGKPVDRDRFGMTPPTVNAYYNALLNEIVFPAGILQPPFFNASADDAVNYGAIGGVIGHEITHGFDDQGSRFDAEGNLKMWWTQEDRKKFDERASCVVDQFSKYEVQPNLFMNGKLTLGENIADLGGLTVAYDAYKNSLKNKQRPENIDGFTPEQRFFLGWAQVWAVKATMENDRLRATTDPHALARWRVNGPLSNMPQFAEAFGCRESQPMVKKDMCEIW
ncbi:MAG: M13 family metallopeptidase [Acidobacteriota bacterium]|jgi:putative endopeptidase|nr:M13 family metallopeptidase [Acidobacteriota bacterium]